MGVKRILVLLAVGLVACGGGGGESATETLSSSTSSSTSSSRISATPVLTPTTSASPVSVSVTPSPTTKPGVTSTATPTSTTKPTVTPTSVTTVTPTPTGGLYSSQPVVASCNAGTLRDAERTKVLEKLNTVRARHGLLPVTYDASDDAAAAAAALYMVANKDLTHTPSSSGLCYTSEAARLAGTSNLYMSYGYNTETSPSTDAIVGYLVDEDVSSLGHRRWILSPFLSQITFGRVDGTPSGGTTKYMASALRVVGNERASLSGMSNDFVAYPYGAYPASEFSTSWYLSFAAIANTSNVWSNDSATVSYANATITVTGGGNTLTVSDTSSNYDGYGMPNHLQWKVAGLKTGVSYTVKIAGVSVNSKTRDYSYTFSLN